ncbi:MAG: hypothetical protein ABSD31_09710 [Candidatus Binataceae bacterium]|jgi:hypothetical protein
MAPPDTKLSMTDSGETGWLQKILVPAQNPIGTEIDAATGSPIARNAGVNREGGDVKRQMVPTRSIS